MDPKVKYLLSLRAIRERANAVREIAEAGKLAHFELREDKLDDVVDFVASVIKVRQDQRNLHRICSKLTPYTPASGTLAQTSTTLSPLMGAGSILKSGGSRASQTSLINGKRKAVMTLR